jgi:hypothetical protein
MLLNEFLKEQRHRIRTQIEQQANECGQPVHGSVIGSIHRNYHSGAV